MPHDARRDDGMHPQSAVFHGALHHDARQQCRFHELEDGAEDVDLELRHKRDVLRLRRRIEETALVLISGLTLNDGIPPFLKARATALPLSQPRFGAVASPDVAGATLTDDQFLRTDRMSGNDRCILIISSNRMAEQQQRYPG